jgi:excinuclease UvrABC nuclease subunit
VAARIVDWYNKNKIMIAKYEGHFSYDYDTINDWDSSDIGVYYCGKKATNGSLAVFYIGSAASDKGIRGRLLQHLGEDKWSDVTHFGYCVCDTEDEALEHETSEIGRLQPKYNKRGK